MPAKLPSFQFYPGDWLKDAELRSCSHAAKGVLIDILCLMFECSERGVLVTSGQAWDDNKVARAVGGDMDVTKECIRELTDSGVLSRSTTTGALYSRRMVRDEEKRKKCSEAGKSGGGNPNFGAKVSANGHPKGRHKGETNSSASDSSSTSDWTELLKDLTLNDLESPPALLAIHARCVAGGLAPDDATRANFFGFAALSRRKSTRNACGYFLTLCRRWNVADIKAEDEDVGAAMLKEALYT